VIGYLSGAELAMLQRDLSLMQAGIAEALAARFIVATAQPFHL
jgi:hypothetical protein